MERGVAGVRGHPIPGNTSQVVLIAYVRRFRPETARKRRVIIPERGPKLNGR